MQQQRIWLDSIAPVIEQLLALYKCTCSILFFSSWFVWNCNLVERYAKSKYFNCCTLGLYILNSEWQCSIFNQHLVNHLMIWICGVIQFKPMKVGANTPYPQSITLLILMLLAQLWWLMHDKSGDYVIQTQWNETHPVLTLHSLDVCGSATWFVDHRTMTGCHK